MRSVLHDVVLAPLLTEEMPNGAHAQRKGLPARVFLHLLREGASRYHQIGEGNPRRLAHRRYLSHQ